MADELELLRRANPVPADGPHFGDGPLGRHAELELDRLMRRPAVRRPRLYWGLAATAIVAALVSALLFSGRTTAPAVAAPRPLVVQADATPVPLATLAERAAAADGTMLRKGTHVKTWSLGMSDDKPPITYPEERIVRWNADDSHTVITDDGHDRTEQTYPPSWSDAPPQSPPPHDVARLRAYLQEATYTKEKMDTGQLLDGVRVLLDTWTLGSRESATLARLLADTDRLRPVGQVIDRLGRRGLAYVYDRSATRHMLIMDPVTGAVLGLETTFTKAQPEYGVKAGDVMDYSAWTR
ncbi:hypothetical protein DI272_11365 [Streptomyces sp. Act143]|uniref:CU044_5270 family protein n=1 Tax=Streptomyces sp. Act143 TaxID=2200760 RepID=UPI000D684C3B|nr:CU044_5270 family protein [Streptomyces sp. Act143]PWI14691.1 hypothetical protein DI272_11365 [Streptomyces sp. Act143]